MCNCLKKSVVWVLLIVWLFWLCPGKVQAEVPADISAAGYVLMEASTGKVLTGREVHTKRPMASTTKIMTALLTLEEPDLDTFFQVDKDAIMMEGSSMGLLPGDTVSFRALSYGMLLASGNDAANLAAVKIGGTTADFAVLMNERAKAIGMKNTHFVNASGLHHEQHYSTPYDMALLAREALQNEEFAEICQQVKAKLSYGNPPYVRWMTNHNQLLTSYRGCIGMKTGFTKKAGRCLVSAAERDGVTLLCVTLNAPNDWQDHTKLLDYGFQTVKTTTILPDLSDVSVPVAGGTSDEIPVKAAETLTVCLGEEEQEQIVRQLLLPRFCYAPIQEGDVVGKVQLLFQEQVIAETDLLAGASVPQKIIPIEKKKSLWERIKGWFC